MPMHHSSFCCTLSSSSLAGFTKRTESEYDPFGAGHSSTSISAGLGMAVGRDFKGKKNQVGGGGGQCVCVHVRVDDAGFGHVPV